MIAASGQTIECTFVNQRSGRLWVRLYDDRNGDGVRQFNQGRPNHEPGLAGWEVRLADGVAQDVQAAGVIVGVTNNQGKVNFNELRPGVYNICETLQSGWSNTEPGASPACYNALPINPAEITIVRMGNHHNTVTSANTAAVAEIIRIADFYEEPDDVSYDVIPFEADPDVNEESDAPITSRVLLPLIMR